MRVMEMRKKVLGKEHPDTLRSMNNLAFTLRGQSRNSDAISVMRRCCELRIRALGPSHPHTKKSLGALHAWEGGEHDPERSD